MPRGQQGAHGGHGPQVVGGHERHGVGAEQPHTAQLAAVQQALQKPRVIGGGGHQPTTTGLHGGHTARVQHPQGNATVRVVGQRLGNAVVVLGQHGKTGVLHPERGKNGLVQVLAQRLAGDDLQQAAQHVGGAAVFPHRARRVHQRQGRELCRKGGVGALSRGDLHLRVLALHGCAAQKFVGEARRVAQQVLHRGGLGHRPQLHHTVHLHRHGGGRKLGQPAGDGV